MAAAVAELRPGVSERELTGVFMDAMASRGVTTPATQDVVRITSAGSARTTGGDRRVQAGDLVAFDAGVVADGYAGEVGRTWPVGLNGSTAVVEDLYRRWDAAVGAAARRVPTRRRRQRAPRGVPGGRRTAPGRCRSDAAWASASTTR